MALAVPQNSSARAHLVVRPPDPGQRPLTLREPLGTPAAPRHGFVRLKMAIPRRSSRPHWPVPSSTQRLAPDRHRWGSGRSALPSLAPGPAAQAAQGRARGRWRARGTRPGGAARVGTGRLADAGWSWSVMAYSFPKRRAATVGRRALGACSQPTRNGLSGSFWSVSRLAARPSQQTSHSETRQGAVLGKGRLVNPCRAVERGQIGPAWGVWASASSLWC